MDFGGSERWDEVMRFEELTGDAGERDLGGGVALRYRQVPHLPPTFALRVEAGGGAVCFGADCADNDALPALAAGADVLLCECSFGAARGPGRACRTSTAREAGGIAARAGAGRLLLTHCFPEQDRDAALAQARARVRRPGAVGRPGEAVPRERRGRPPPTGRRALIIASCSACCCRAWGTPTRRGWRGRWSGSGGRS